MSYLLRSPRSSTLSSAYRTFSTSSARQTARMTLVGRLGTNPESTQSKEGKEIIRYVIGTNHGSRDNESTSWFRIAAFPPTVGSRDYLMNLPKGTLVYFEGDAKMRPYEDADGKKSSSLGLVQTKLEVLKRPIQQSDAAET